jgi:hypothetical protein
MELKLKVTASLPGDGVFYDLFIALQDSLADNLPSTILDDDDDEVEVEWKVEKL